MVGFRWAATAYAAAGPIVIGALFGLGLTLVAWGGGWRPEAERWPAIVVGAAGGSALVAVTLLTRAGNLPSLLPAAIFGPWVVVTAVVASAEEIVLRGALFDAVDDAIGTVAAVVITSIVFALMHVPLYGWHVVPLDLGVGLWLAGLRSLRPAASSRPRSATRSPTSRPGGSE